MDGGVGMTKPADWVRIAHGSFGSRNGQPWSRELAQANDRTRASDIGAGIHGAGIAPSKDALRAAIEAQTCPWCGAGPYKVLAGHTNTAHGVSGRELRELAGVGPRGSICSPEASAQAREKLVTRDDWEDMRKRGNAQANAAGAHKSAVEAQAKRHLEENGERDELIVAAVMSGEPRTEVARRFGLTPHSVARMLKRRGINIDGRTERGNRLKGAVPTAAREGWARAQAERLAERSARWAALGGDHEALIRLAKELDTSHKALRAYFKKAGMPVPDGRK